MSLGEKQAGRAPVMISPWFNYVNLQTPSCCLKAQVKMCGPLSSSEQGITSPLLVKATLLTRGKQEVDHFDDPPE